MLFSLENLSGDGRKRYLLCFRIIFRPKAHKLIQMVWSKDGPISCQVVKIVHDHSHKQVDNLNPHKQYIAYLLQTQAHKMTKRKNTNNFSFICVIIWILYTESKKLLENTNHKYKKNILGALYLGAITKFSLAWWYYYLMCRNLLSEVFILCHNFVRTKTLPLFLTTSSTNS